MASTALPLRTAFASRIVHGTLLTRPTTLDMALFSSQPALDGTGGTELAGNGYVRKSIQLTPANWTRTGTSVTNATSITTANATGGWAPVTHVGFYNGSNLWFLGNLLEPVTIANGSAFSFSPNTLRIDLTGNWTTAVRQIIVEWLFREGSITWPTSFLIRLTSTIPTADTPGTELSGEGYGTPTINNVPASWTVDEVEPGKYSNASLISFGQATGNWAEVVGVDLIDPANSLRWISLTVSRRLLTSGNTARLIPGGLTILVD